MFLTTEQATKTWCPMSRIARREEWHEASGAAGSSEAPRRIEIHEIVGGVNRDALDPRAYTPESPFPRSCRCFADKCAMWRWADNATLTPYPTAYGIHAAATRRGFCGLAGAPIKD